MDYIKICVFFCSLLISQFSFADKGLQNERWKKNNWPPYFQRGIYINFWAASSQSYLNRFFASLKTTSINTVVLDVKNEYGELFYKSDIEFAKTISAHRSSYIKDGQQFIKQFKQHNIYTIARIPVFKDALLAQKLPHLSVKDQNLVPWITGNQLSWSDPFNQQVHDYNIQIAIDAAKMGFDEIQYDYIRFPEQSGLVYSKQSTQQSRVKAIQDFLKLSQEKLDDYPIKTSIATFGYACWNKSDTQIGQQIKKLAPYVDYISPMLYPSGFHHGIPGYRNSVVHADKIISLSLKRCVQRTGLAADQFRPWLQAFSDYSFDRRAFKKPEIQAQIQAAQAAGSHGWLLWNPASRYRSSALIK